jgi:hypothetical protein
MLQLKTVAFGLMILLNLAWCGLIKNSLLQFVLGFLGSISIPLFLFIMNESLEHTGNITRYMIRVLVLALVSALPYYIVYTDFGSDRIQLGAFLSSPFTIFYCIGAINLYKKISQPNIKLIALVFFVLTSWFIGVEWAPYAIILAFIIHSCNERPNYRDYNIIMFFVVIALVSAVFCFAGSGPSDELIKNISLSGVIAGIPLIRMYNGEQGVNDKNKKLMKWSFYVAYPAFLVCIMLIKMILAKG